VLKKHEYFGKYGKIQKVVINQSTSYAGSQGPSASAYVTYLKADDALRAIQAVNNISVDGRTLKTSLGTTKYCSNFMKNQTCLKPDCMYLHELGDPDASFTKEEMQQGKHQEYEKKLHEQLLATVNRDRKPTPSPPAASCQGENNINQANQSCGKEAWPSLQPSTAVSATIITILSCFHNCQFFLLPIKTLKKKFNNLIHKNDVSRENYQPQNCKIVNKNQKSESQDNTNMMIFFERTINNSTKTENGQRKQRFEAQITKAKNQKTNKHTLGEESKGKSKEKCASSVQNEHETGNTHRKSEELQNSSSSYSECSHDIGGTNHHTELMFGSTRDDVEIQENDIGNTVTRQQLNRLLLTNHTSTLFEPDNNSFFSTNNFTKVSATYPGTGTTDWLPLTHIPDVMPPVHSSEDWQAAFGFANSYKYQIDSYHSELCSKTSKQVSLYPIQISKTCFEVNKMSSSRISLNQPKCHITSMIASNNQSTRHDGGRLTDDELGFDPFHETQKALAEMIENEDMMGTTQESANNRRNNKTYNMTVQYCFANTLPPNVSNCTKLLNGLGIGPSSVNAARTRLPPPGFTTAPNHMNAFGLGIPRAPSSSCSKILPFMGLGNSSSCSPPPVPQTMTTHPQHQGVLFPSTIADKGWNGTDWTALDPAIVSSSGPPNFLPIPHSANIGLCPVMRIDHDIQQSNTDHCHLYSNSSVGPPPPGFSPVSANASVGNIEIS
ncbi:hypothetical protein L9F63_022169, partial [Diploptera punctata]